MRRKRFAEPVRRQIPVRAFRKHVGGHLIILERRPFHDVCVPVFCATKRGIFLLFSVHSASLHPSALIVSLCLCGRCLGQTQSQSGPPKAKTQLTYTETTT